MGGREAVESRAACLAQPAAFHIPFARPAVLVDSFVDSKPGRDALFVVVWTLQEV